MVRPGSCFTISRTRSRCSGTTRGGFPLLLRQRLQAPRLSLLPLPSVERLLVAGREQSAAALVDEVGAAALRDALARCRELEQVGEHGLFDELLARHAHMKRYLPAFLDLPFEGQPGTESLLAAIAMARQWNTVRISEIVASIEASGQTVRPEHLARISPLAHAHVIPSGTYHFDRATARARG